MSEIVTVGSMLIASTSQPASHGFSQPPPLHKDDEAEDRQHHRGDAIQRAKGGAKQPPRAAAADPHPLQ
jgi:hypothetical protein